MKYAELLSDLLEKNLVQTRASLRVLNKLLNRWIPNLFCAFHQGAPVHDTKQCYSLKVEVQKLINVNILSFKDWIRMCKLTHYRIMLPNVVTLGGVYRN